MKRGIAGSNIISLEKGPGEGRLLSKKRFGRGVWGAACECFAIGARLFAPTGRRANPLRRANLRQRPVKPSRFESDLKYRCHKRQKRPTNCLRVFADAAGDRQAERFANGLDRDPVEDLLKEASDDHLDRFFAGKATRAGVEDQLFIDAARS